MKLPLSRRSRSVVALAVLAAAVAIVFLIAGRPQLLPATKDGESCGNSLNGPQGYNPHPPDCLWRAYQLGETARAVMVDLTTEGDPITYAVDVSGTSVRVSIQSKDRFGLQGTFAYECTGLTQKAAANDSGHTYLLATGCAGPQGFLDDRGDLTIP